MISYGINSYGATLRMLKNGLLMRKFSNDNLIVKTIVNSVYFVSSTFTVTSIKLCFIL